MKKELGTRTYVAVIDSEYSDGQAIVTHPDGEMGGDHYVELSRSYDLYIGVYRGQSTEQIKQQAAKDADVDPGVISLYRVTQEIREV